MLKFAVFTRLFSKMLILLTRTGCLFAKIRSVTKELAFRVLGPPWTWL